VTDIWTAESYLLLLTALIAWQYCLMLPHARPSIRVQLRDDDHLFCTCQQEATAEKPAGVAAAVEQENGAPLLSGFFFDAAAAAGLPPPALARFGPPPPDRILATCAMSFSCLAVSPISLARSASAASSE
jgi:hypothetical protein